MESPTNKTVLITGINGFTGKHLEAFLKNKGYTVYGTSFSTPKNENHFKCDILNSVEIRNLLGKVQPNYIIHLAAISFVASKDVSKIYETNVIGTLNLLESVIDLQIKADKILLASSAAIYGNIGSILSEEMCPKPANHYGNSKLAMENMAANFFSKLNIIITRPFNYTGIGQEEHFLIPKIVSHFKQKKHTIELGNIDTFREYNNVEFLIDNYEKLLTSNFDSGAVNIASGSTYSIKDILEIMTDISSHSIRININEKFIRKHEIKELKGSSKKLIKLAGKITNEFSLKKTLEQMYFS
ncbi:GDP-mannose 4,6-dehydratase [Croceitalea marina]|uniref:GDP-mannose 4,6-dehydratase n=1 Tax=Croceitalea marina TaxID=1775166 RepID=A0ABW5N0C2_9FLAO